MLLGDILAAYKIPLKRTTTIRNGLLRQKDAIKIIITIKEQGESEEWSSQ